MIEKTHILSYGVRSVKQMKETKRPSDKKTKIIRETHDYYLKHIDATIGRCITYLLCVQPENIVEAMLEYFDRLSRGESIDLNSKVSREKPRVDQKLLLTTKIAPVVTVLVNKLMIAKPENPAEFLTRELQAFKETIATEKHPKIVVDEIECAQASPESATSGDNKKYSFGIRPQTAPELTEASNILSPTRNLTALLLSDDSSQKDVGKSSPIYLSPKNALFAEFDLQKTDDDINLELDKVIGEALDTKNESVINKELSALASFDVNDNGNVEVPRLPSIKTSPRKDDLPAAPKSPRASVVPVVPTDAQTAKKIQLAVVGVGGSGKTTILNSVQGRVDGQPKPTVGFRPITLSLNSDTSVCFYDIGGGKKIREIWPQYYHDVHGVIFVVDSSLSADFDDTRECFNNVVSNPYIQGKPVLVFANKFDLVQASIEEIRSRLASSDVRIDGPFNVVPCTGLGVNSSPDTQIAKFIKITSLSVEGVDGGSLLQTQDIFINFIHGEKILSTDVIRDVSSKATFDVSFAISSLSPSEDIVVEVISQSLLDGDKSLGSVKMQAKDLYSPTFSLAFRLVDRDNAELGTTLMIEGQLLPEAQLDALNQKSSEIIPDSVVTKLPDPRIDSGIEWLLNTVIQEFPSLNDRVCSDTKKKSQEEAAKRVARERKVLRNKIMSAFPQLVDPSLLPEDMSMVPEDTFSEDEGLSFLASEIGEDVSSLPDIGRKVAAMVGYQRLALQIIGTLKAPVSKKKEPIAWEGIEALIQDIRKELKLE